MTITLNYQKRKNINLFNKFQSNPSISLSNVQNYIPIYDKFFSLNSTNFNSVNLNHNWFISDIKDSKKVGKNKSKNINDNNNDNTSDNDDDNSIDDTNNIYTCKLKNISGDEDMSITQKVFIKMAPLLDPFKYLVGKYNHKDTNLFNLPTFDKSANVHNKIVDPNNSAYVDSFFSFLSSQVLNKHKFIHAIDFYGSFLSVKNNYKINIIDDLDYLLQSDFFNKQKNVLFKVEDFSHLIAETGNETEVKPTLNIMNKSIANLSLKSIDDTIFENIFDNPVSLDDVKILNIDLVDITNSLDITDTKKSASIKSGSSCSSRTSHTNDSENNDDTNNDEYNDTNNEDDTNNDVLENNDSEQETINVSNNNDSNNESNNESDADDDDDVYSTDDSDDIECEKLYLTFDKFPVHLICLELCENTLDDYIINNDISTDEWFAILMQVIMTLITYQKLFSFTHNDLHTNNIMYVPTNKKFLYYYYKKQYYKVPTFGKIFKIIDFGRAIYKFNGDIFCSDSFQPGGDAATQYNTEPYFNPKKPRLEPNFSFDLCRLACSIFDYVVEDFEDIKNINECEPIVKLIVDWCIDDNGINVLYKNNGAERYPDFKLYKMIARCVHNHTPNAQLERSEFSKFGITKMAFEKGKGKTDVFMNIDELPSYISTV